MIVLLGAICIIGIGWLFFTAKSGTSGPYDVSTTTPHTNLKEFSIPEHSIRFAYPSNYFVSTSTGAGGHVQVVLMEDIPENHALNEVPREGPTAITLEIYPNTERLSAEAWVKKNATTTNYSLRKGDGMLRPSFIAAHDVFEYEWSGLYEGMSNVMVHGPTAHVWSVTRLTPDDQILKDYLGILTTIAFMVSETEDPSLQ